MYDSFSIGSEKENYELRLSGYNQELSTLADGFTLGNHINQPFTTSDKDNDNRETHVIESMSVFSHQIKIYWQIPI